MLHRPLVYSAVNKNLTLWQGVKVGCMRRITSYSMSPQESKWWLTVQIAKTSCQPPCKTNKNLRTQLWVEIRQSKIHRLLPTRLFKVDKSSTHRNTSQKTSYKFWMSIGRVVSEKVNLNKPHWPGSAWRSCASLRSKKERRDFQSSCKWAYLGDRFWFMMIKTDLFCRVGPNGVHFSED